MKNLTLLKKKISDNRYGKIDLYKTISEKEIMVKSLKKSEPTKNLKENVLHENLQNIIKIENSKSSKKIVLPYYKNNLYNYSEKLKNEKELKKFIFDLTKILAYFQKNEISHKKIRPEFISYNEKKKIFILLEFFENYFFDNKFVIAPEIFEIYYKKNLFFEENYKSDIFSLGMSLLYSIYDKEKISELYDLEKYIFDFEKLNKILESLKNEIKGSEEFFDLLRDNVLCKESGRKDFVEFEIILKDLKWGVGEGDFANGIENYIEEENLEEKNEEKEENQILKQEEKEIKEQKEEEIDENEEKKEEQKENEEQKEEEIDENEEKKEENQILKQEEKENKGQKEEEKDEKNLTKEINKEENLNTIDIDNLSGKEKKKIKNLEKQGKENLGILYEKIKEDLKIKEDSVENLKESVKIEYEDIKKEEFKDEKENSIENKNIFKIKNENLLKNKNLGEKKENDIDKQNEKKDFKLYNHSIDGNFKNKNINNENSENEIINKKKKIKLSKTPEKIFKEFQSNLQKNEKSIQKNQIISIGTQKNKKSIAEVPKNIFLQTKISSNPIIKKEIENFEIKKTPKVLNTRIVYGKKLNIKHNEPLKSTFRTISKEEYEKIKKMENLKKNKLNQKNRRSDKFIQNLKKRDKTPKRSAKRENKIFEEKKKATKKGNYVNILKLKNISKSPIKNIIVKNSYNPQNYISSINIKNSLNSKISKNPQIVKKSDFSKNPSNSQFSENSKNPQNLKNYKIVNDFRTPLINREKSKGRQYQTFKKINPIFEKHSIINIPKKSNFRYVKQNRDYFSNIGISKSYQNSPDLKDKINGGFFGGNTLKGDFKFGKGIEKNQNNDDSNYFSQQ